ncbi:hypothetical protein NDI76_09210 [Halogeometricum sp. S1BR25-6]|uniref:DUF7344 domain-containing protein n=1 Tax=Halogeometricum salsisoli TaxID=2950536 RepID=A0ABU2GDQ1_9EURY|nr:hypothetical protein [Halogeometricum sp. S1BR25-6]MDS0298923.1 hypothetical protein [Halogeometricum sp. S1BR25-6]
MNDTIATFADRDRRTVLSCLDDRRGTVDIESLATDVVAERESTAPDEVADADRETALIRLHHVDLPKLDEAGFVDFDHEAGTVDRRARPAPTSTALSD